MFAIAKTKQTMFVLAGIVVVVVIAGLVLTTSSLPYGTQTQQTAQTTEARLPSISVSDQALVGNEVTVASAYIDKPGYIVIHADSGTGPGAVIGHSELVSGDVSNLKIAIDSAQAGTKVFAMLHYDDDSDGVYGFPDEDKPVQLGGGTLVKPIGITQETTQAQAPTVREITLEGDDSSFYLDGAPITSLSAASGETIKLILKTRTTNVAFGGLQYKTSDFGGVDTGKVSPGSQAEVEITVNSAGMLRSYWPDTNFLKGTLNIVIA